MQNAIDLVREEDRKISMEMANIRLEFEQVGGAHGSAHDVSGLSEYPAGGPPAQPAGPKTIDTRIVQTFIQKLQGTFYCSHIFANVFHILNKFS